MGSLRAAGSDVCFWEGESTREGGWSMARGDRFNHEKREECKITSEQRLYLLGDQS